MLLAAAREPAIRFMIGLVSPTLTQSETDLWANLNGQGQSMPTRTDEDMEAEVRRAGPGGVDPMPSIRAMRIPAIWLYGGKDRIVPSRLCVERLDPASREPGRDFSYRVFPGGTHGLILTANASRPRPPPRTAWWTGSTQRSAIGCEPAIWRHNSGCDQATLDQSGPPLAAA
jgi:pimeloyl-ACP methyl ester carboxylesterase